MKTMARDTDDPDLRSRLDDLATPEPTRAADNRLDGRTREHLQKLLDDLPPEGREALAVAREARERERREGIEPDGPSDLTPAMYAKIEAVTTFNQIPVDPVDVDGSRIDDYDGGPPTLADPFAAVEGAEARDPIYREGGGS